MRKYSLQIELFFVVIIILFFACGCGGTRNSNIEKHEDLTIQNSYLEGSKIVLGNTFTYTPFDALKPMKIEGKVYENAIIKSDKSVTKETYKYFNIYHHYRLDDKRQTTRKDNTWLYIGLFAVLVLGVLAFLKLPSFKKDISL
jgi:hypothetical protein